MCKSSHVLSWCCPYNSLIREAWLVHVRTHMHVRVHGRTHTQREGGAGCNTPAKEIQPWTEERHLHSVQQIENNSVFLTLETDCQERAWGGIFMVWAAFNCCCYKARKIWNDGHQLSLIYFFEHTQNNNRKTKSVFSQAWEEQAIYRIKNLKEGKNTF